MPTTAPGLAELKALLIGSKSLPVLFIGSGLSRRYLGTPSWEGLIEYAASLTPYPVSYFDGRLPGGTPKDDRLPLIASGIADQFYDIWWGSDAYRNERERLEHDGVTVASPLKYKLAQYIQDRPLPSDPDVAREYAKFGHSKAHAIITTNYDSMAESTFPTFRTYVGQADVLFSSPQYVGEIYKIHGSVEDPASMVLDSNDYETYRIKNPYLTAKILTLFVEHPVILMGYSLRDPHISSLLQSLVSCLSEAQLETFNKRLIFVGRIGDHRPEGLASSSITVSAHTFGVTELGINDFGDVYDMLSELPEQYSVELLRHLSDQVTQMAYSSASADRIHVLPLQEGERVEDAQMVVGVGAFERLGIKGYAAYSRADIMLDMIAMADDHNMPLLVQKLVPHLFRNAKFSPIHYIRFLAQKHGYEFVISELPIRARTLLQGEAALAPYQGRRPQDWETQTFRALRADHPDLIDNLCLGCVYEEEDVVALGEYLLPHIEGKSVIPTPVAKAAAKFDHLVYGDGFDGDAESLRSLVKERLGRPRY